MLRVNRSRTSPWSCSCWWHVIWLPWKGNRPLFCALWFLQITALYLLIFSWLCLAESVWCMVLLSPLCVLVYTCKVPQDISTSVLLFLGTLCLCFFKQSTFMAPTRQRAHFTNVISTGNSNWMKTMLCYIFNPCYVVFHVMITHFCAEFCDGTTWVEGDGTSLHIEAWWFMHLLSIN